MEMTDQPDFIIALVNIHIYILGFKRSLHPNYNKNFSVAFQKAATSD